jgi:hypothetical protein
MSLAWNDTRVIAAGLASAHPSIQTHTFDVVNNGMVSYLVNGEVNPTLKLVRGETYVFNVTASGHTMWIKTTHTTTSANAYNLGVTGNGTSNGTITFVVPMSAPATLYYDCQFHSGMSGRLDVISSAPALPLAGSVMLAVAIAWWGAAWIAGRRRASSG